MCDCTSLRLIAQILHAAHFELLLPGHERRSAHRQRHNQDHGNQCNAAFARVGGSAEGTTVDRAWWTWLFTVFSDVPSIAAIAAASNPKYLQQEHILELAVVFLCP
jgi:hypothetical protein